MDNINFMDLIALIKIKPDTPVEKFGAEINASFFDSSNILGGLRTKGLIDFSVNFPDQNKIQVTDAGKQLMQDAEQKSGAEFDLLDMEILRQLSGAKRDITDISGALNIRPVDLAFRLYKLLKGDYISYNFKNANIEIMLTETGFIKVKSGIAQQSQGQIPQAPAAVQNAPQGQISNANQEGAAQTEESLQSNQIYASFENKVKQIKLINKNIIIISSVIILFVIFLIFKAKIASSI
ncbi:MAG: hypothetical protein M1331_00670 [Candidatus Marsarchaeota archaeon]|nr:hypothetical protein [Candidatus Marsarchaeota archaeon]